jgi:hypothetical protein
LENEVIQLTKEEAAARLSNPRNLVNTIHKRDWERQSNGGDKNTNGRAGKFSLDEKEMIVSLAEELGNKDTASLVGCNPASIPYWRNGINSKNTGSNAPSTHVNKEVAINNQERISEKSVEKVLRAVELIDEEKLVACNATELATIASRLATLSIKKQQEGGGINIVVYTPQVKSESQFETITIESKS